MLLSVCANNFYSILGLLYSAYLSSFHHYHHRSRQEIDEQSMVLYQNLATLEQDLRKETEEFEERKEVTYDTHSPLGCFLSCDSWGPLTHLLTSDFLRPIINLLVIPGPTWRGSA